MTSKTVVFRTDLACTDVSTGERVNSEQVSG